jgi:hypothetical protein
VLLGEAAVPSPPGGRQDVTRGIRHVALASVLCDVGLIATLAPANWAAASPAAEAQDERCAGTDEAARDERLSESGADVARQQPFLVEHEDETIEWMWFYIVERADGETLLIDEDRKSYEDLDDFRANNDLLSESDTMIVPRNMMNRDPSSDVELMEVSGHSSDWYGAASWPMGDCHRQQLWHDQPITRATPSQAATRASSRSGR